MAMAAHDPAFAKRVGISMSVAHDFNQADKAAGNLKKKSKLPGHVKPRRRTILEG